MRNKIDLEEVKRIQSEYDNITNSINRVCNIIERFAYNKQLPRIPTYSLWVFKQGIVYPEYGWTFVPQVGAEEAKLRVSAWDGCDTDPCANTSILIPFDFINMEDEELIKLLKGE